MIKIVDWQKYKSGTRLFVVCGIRAFRAFEQMRGETTAIRTLLSAKNGALLQAVQHQAQELENARFRVVQAENELFSVLVQSVDPNQPVFLQQEHLSTDALRRLCSAVSAKTSHLCAVFTSNENGTLSYAMAQTLPNADLRPLCTALNQAFCGRGGGKPGFVQGSITANFDAAVAFLQANL
jgi:alanyl-tRNA synthetase